MDWKFPRLIIPFALLTLLFLTGKLLEVSLSRNITGTSKEMLQDTTQADKPSQTAALADDVFANAARRQEVRKKQLENYCLTHIEKYKPPDKKQLGQLLIVDDNYLIYCSVPKVASTSMKLTLLSLRNTSGNILLSGSAHVHGEKMWERMKQYNTSDILKRLETHFKFLFVREPFHRLLSAYKDKFVGNNRIYTQKFRQKIVQSFRPQDVEEIGTTTNNVTFTEFLKFIVTYPDFFSSRDAHWRQYEHLCFPCTIEYNFIGHYETLADDAAYLLKMAGIDDRVVFPPVHSSKADTDFLTYYSQVPYKLIFELAKAFRSDFEMFGYPFPGPLIEVLAYYTM